MKLCYLIMSLFLATSAIQASESSSIELSYSYDEEDTYNDALAALKEVKRKLGTLENHSSNTGKVATEMLRLIQFAQLQGYTKQGAVTDSRIEHSENGTYASFQTLDKDNRSINFYVEYQQSEYNTHVTVSLNYPESYGASEFFGQTSNQFVATLFFYECASIELRVDTGDVKKDQRGVSRKVLKAWSLDCFFDDLEWSEGFFEVNQYGNLANS